MPFTAPLLSVAASQFDVLVHLAGTYHQGAAGGSNQFKYSNQTTGTFTVISDPNSITVGTTDTGNFDGLGLATGHTYEITVLKHKTYSASLDNINNSAGFVSLSSSPSVPPSSFAITTFTSNATQTVNAATITLSGTSNYLNFGIKRVSPGQTFTASDNMVIGINQQ